MSADPLSVAAFAVLVLLLVLVFPAADALADRVSPALFSVRAAQLIAALAALAGAMTARLVVLRRRRHEARASKATGEMALSLLRADLARPRPERINRTEPTPAGLAPAQDEGMADGERGRAARRADPHQATGTEGR